MAMTVEQLVRERRALNCWHAARKIAAELEHHHPTSVQEEDLRRATKTVLELAEAFLASSRGRVTKLAS
jgi:hypothetical protein